MNIQTGEDDRGLIRISDMSRAVGILLLLLHFYYYFGYVFPDFGFVTNFVNFLILKIADTGIFFGFNFIKLISVCFLCLSLWGRQGKKDVSANYVKSIILLLLGTVIYFSTYYLVFVIRDGISLAYVYASITIGGYCLILAGASSLSRIISASLENNDIFNVENESFPQEERLITNDISINLPASYNLSGKRRKSWINFINPRRGILVMGSPGSGKSYFVVENSIRQLIGKGFSIFIYDYKFPDLTELAYNEFLKYQHKYPLNTAFYSINFDDLCTTHRCNPISKVFLSNITDAIESSRTIMLSINRTWVNKQGEFFVESPINMLTAAIWFLRKYHDGEYCTLPHAIELVHIEYEKLFTVLRAEPEIEILIDPFVKAFENNVMETLDSQMASLKIPLGRLASQEIYYILSNDDLTLDINNPNNPKIFCLGNSPEKHEALTPILSLYINRLNKIINQKGKL